MHRQSVLIADKESPPRSEMKKRNDTCFKLRSRFGQIRSEKEIGSL
ncbi:MAG: hypothetical protein ACYTBZ_08655 [Planctomycetota bacterium]